MSSESIKAEVIKQVRTQYNIDNAKQLIEKVNEHCFEKCVPKPSSGLSSGESTCFTQCMDKYMLAWNTVDKTCMTRVQRESQFKSL
ncbi:mitochondrial import inner membrane translocase subunit TIM13 [Whalleya microplaca]|nr:mitochondrial import inner membrane translocase subunit TIM13 [Whalleya microplaca]